VDSGVAPNAGVFERGAKAESTQVIEKRKFSKGDSLEKGNGSGALKAARN